VVRGSSSTRNWADRKHARQDDASFFARTAPGSACPRLAREAEGAEQRLERAERRLRKGICKVSSTFGLSCKISNRVLSEVSPSSRYRERDVAAVGRRSPAISRSKRRFSGAVDAHHAPALAATIKNRNFEKMTRSSQASFSTPPRSAKTSPAERREQGVRRARHLLEFDFLIRRRERWCVMGVNGAGKSTLLRLIAGESTPTAATSRSR